MDVKNMSAEVRKEEQAPKAAAKPAKTSKTSEEVEPAKVPDAGEVQQTAAANAAAAAAHEAQPREAVKAAAEQPRKTDPFKALAASYAKYYPHCKAFHITSDKQVFLDKDKNLALLHQAGLGEGEVRTINVH